MAPTSDKNSPLPVHNRNLETGERGRASLLEMRSPNASYSIRSITRSFVSVGRKLSLFLAARAMDALPVFRPRIGRIFPDWPIRNNVSFLAAMQPSAPEIRDE